MRLPNKKPPRRYLVEWDEAPWERELWRSDETFPRVSALIDGLARESGRQEFADNIIPLDDRDIQVPYTVDANGRFLFGDIERVDRRAVALAHAIHRAMGTLAREEAVRTIRQIDERDGDGVIRRKITVRWDRQTQPEAEQLKSLETAFRSGSQYKIEVAWFGLTMRAHEYLSVGYHVARRRGNLVRYEGPFEETATIIRIPMLARELLAIILPYAVSAIARGGRPPVHPRDEALARVLGVFVEITGVTSAAACQGAHGEPAGPGADFVRAIQTIFRTELMPTGSTHAVARAKRRLSDAAG